MKKACDSQPNSHFFLAKLLQIRTVFLANHDDTSATYSRSVVFFEQLLWKKMRKYYWKTFLMRPPLQVLHYRFFPMNIGKCLRTTVVHLKQDASVCSKDIGCRIWKNQFDHWSLSKPPENIKKPKVFCLFRGYKHTSGMKWVNCSNLKYLFIRAGSSFAINTLRVPHFSMTWFSTPTTIPLYLVSWRNGTRRRPGVFSCTLSLRDYAEPSPLTIWVGFFLSPSSPPLFIQSTLPTLQPYI